MSAEFTIGIDLGGTNIKGGVCDAQARLTTTHSVPTEAEQGFDHVFDRMQQLVRELLERAQLSKNRIAGVGLGTPGPLSAEEGIVHNAPNLPGWVEVPLRRMFSEAIKMPVALENDANAAAYGEFLVGAGRAVRSMVMLTLGTGVGGGIVVDSHIWRGADDTAGELGHTILLPNGRPCPCGQRGCLERYASANAVGERFSEALAAGEQSSIANEKGGRPTAVDVERGKGAGDPLATRIWDETCFYLALGCINVERLICPELIVLAGGLIKAGDSLLTPVREHFYRNRWNLTKPALQINFAELGTDAGVIGAASLARERIKAEA